MEGRDRMGEDGRSAVFLWRGDLQTQADMAHLVTKFSVSPVIEDYNSLVRTIGRSKLRAKQRVKQRSEQHVETLIPCKMGSCTYDYLFSQLEDNIAPLGDRLHFLCAHLECTKTVDVPQRGNAKNGVSGGIGIR